MSRSTLDVREVGDDIDIRDWALDDPDGQDLARVREVCDEIEQQVYYTVRRTDILPALKGKDSPKGSSRLRVSSVLKDAFARNVVGRRPVVTRDVLFSAYSPVDGAFRPTRGRRFDATNTLVAPRWGIQPTRYHDSRRHGNRRFPYDPEALGLLRL